MNEPDMRFWPKSGFRLDSITPTCREFRKRKKRYDKPRFPDYPTTLKTVRVIVEGMISERSTKYITAEGVAHVCRLSRGFVQRSFGQLRTEGLMNPPRRRTHPGTWRGGGYDDWSVWIPTEWTVRLRG